MTQQEMTRRWLNQRFSDLNIGWNEDIDKLSDDDLWDLVDALEVAQTKGELDIETEQGLTNLQEIVDQYFD